MTLPWRTLTSPLSVESQDQIKRYLGELLAWNLELRDWPEPPDCVPAAAPIVSVYSNGTLRGCFGSSEPGPGAIVRALLRALHDGRFHPIAPEERKNLTVCVSFLRTPQEWGVADVLSVIEPGYHGLALVSRGRVLGMLHPSVAEEQGLDARGLMRALAQKAGRSSQSRGEGTLPFAWEPSDRVFLFTTTNIVARSGRILPEVTSDTPRQAALRWLMSNVAPDGQMTFAIEPRKNLRENRGPLHHGRVAVALSALTAFAPGSPITKRALLRLTWDVERSLGGNPVDAWPDDPESVASTLALARLAGAPLQAPLTAIAQQSWLKERIWSAAQVVTALGHEAPPSLTEAVLNDSRSGWCPWKARACVAAGRGERLSQYISELLSVVREDSPYAGGVGEPIAETARTAATLEALLSVPRSPEILTAIEKARAFLRRWQLRADRLAWLEIEQDGAFPVSPLRSYSRIDVTGHALLASEE